jgi:hypothetical protein
MYITYGLPLIFLIAVTYTWWPYCCCPTTPPAYFRCVNCSGAGDNAPEYMTVYVAGIENGSCSSCATYNGTFLIGLNPGLECAWQSGFLDSPCGTAANWFVQVNVTLVGSDYIVSVYVRIDSGTTVFAWQKNYGTAKPDCLEFVGLSVPYVSTAGSLCGGTAPTAEVDSGNTT